MRVLCVGCVHGYWEELARLVNTEIMKGGPIDLIVTCGDGKTFRNEYDMHFSAIPPKYRQLMSFHKLHSGAVKMPVPCIYVGGNHDASLYLAELPYGGWIAPNVYYLGNAGAVDCVFGDRHIRVAGASGIYKSHDARKPRYELPGFDQTSLRSIYHHRHADMDWLVGALQRQPPLQTLMLSHDWPAISTSHMDITRQLKRHCQDEARTGQLGSPLTSDIVSCINSGSIATLGETHWYSAHMHFRADTTIPATGAQGAPVLFTALGKDLKHDGWTILELDDATLRQSLATLQGVMPTPMPEAGGLFYAPCLPMAKDPLSKEPVRSERQWVPVPPFSHRLDNDTFRFNPQTVSLCEATGLPMPYTVEDGTTMKIPPGKEKGNRNQRGPMSQGRQGGRPQWHNSSARQHRPGPNPPGYQAPQFTSAPGPAPQRPMPLPVPVHTNRAAPANRPLAAPGQGSWGPPQVGVDPFAPVPQSVRREGPVPKRGMRVPGQPW
ncbi:hypothetical protein KIPB_007216 [Kipferlia bialata]|uniref:Calcineurin-like phosphoesterase domain-containing protein n=1 Tax=Kipferlia bialata TaxID=797122 RepID=A0A9K3CY74_9EUKA|nr:hypothetical protein KIPB_007216 [Kipferlia bialata]|eukprot:g7216.t1